MLGTTSSPDSCAVDSLAHGVGGILADLRTNVSACRLCPRMAPFKKVAPDDSQTLSTGYMLVANAPDKRGRLFHGPAGQALRAALRAVEDPRYRELEDLFFMTAAARCSPRQKNDKRKLRPPTVAECRNCRPYLHLEMRALHPRLILAVGAQAAGATLDEPVRVEEVHGQRHRIREGQVLTLLSPAPSNRASMKRLGITPETYSRWLTGLFGTLIDELR